jgi:hypothetical protein
MLLKKNNMDSTFKIVQWNCRGLNANFSPILFQFLKECPIYAVQETFLKRHQRYSVPGYTILRNDREDGQQGGVAFLVPKKYIITDWETFNTNNFEGITLTINCTLGDVKIINIYCPRGNITDTDLREIRTRIISKTIILGDFNVRHSTWGGSKDSVAGKKLMEFIENNHLAVVNDGTPTRINPDPKFSDNALDITIITTNITISHWSVSLDTNSDHLPIEIEIGEPFKYNNGIENPRFNF